MGTEGANDTAAMIYIQLEQMISSVGLLWFFCLMKLNQLRVPILPISKPLYHK